MQEVINWIDRELARLDLIIEGKAVEAVPESVPEALKAALGDCV